MWILIELLRQKPVDLDLQCLKNKQKNRFSSTSVHTLWETAYLHFILSRCHGWSTTVGPWYVIVVFPGHTQILFQEQMSLSAQYLSSNGEI